MKGLILATAAIAVCLVSGCGPNPKAPAAQGSSAALGVAAPTTGSTDASPDKVINFSDLPLPRAGLWQKTEDDGDGKPSTETVCFSGKISPVKVPQHCSQFTIKRKMLGGFVMDMNCASPEFSLVSHAEMGGDFQSRMSSDMAMTVTSKRSPAPIITKIHGHYRYLGQCAPGQAADDQF